MELLVVADDEEAREKLKSIQQLRRWDFTLASAEGLTTLPKEAVQLMHWDFGTSRYIETMSRRPQYIARFLDAGCSVLFTDIDVVWKGNVLAEIQGLSGGSGDMYATLDQGKTMESDKKTGRIPVFNGGFIFYQPTPFTKKVVHRWADKLKAHPNRNQPMLNAIIHNSGVDKVQRLLQPKFLDGRATRKKADQAVAVHANFMTGRDAKVAFLKKVGLWIDLPPLTDTTLLGAVPGISMPTSDFAERASKLTQISPKFKDQEAVQAEHNDTNETTKTHVDEAPSSEKKAATEKPQSGEASSRDEVQKTESGDNSSFEVVWKTESGNSSEEPAVVFVSEHDEEEAQNSNALKAAENSSTHLKMLSNESQPKSATKAEQPSKQGQSKLAQRSERLSKKGQSKSATKAEKQPPREEKPKLVRILRSEAHKTLGASENWAHKMLISGNAELSETSGF